MKKYFLLISALAVAACGGGGGVSDEGNPRTPGNPTTRLRAQDVIGDSASDNNKITSMASAVVIANGFNYSSVARAASAPDTTSHAGYTIYKLDNVDFKLVDKGDATFNFEINPDGRIVKAVFDGHEIDRDTTDTSVFSGRIFQLVPAAGGDDIDTMLATDSTTQTDLDNFRDRYLANTLHNGNIEEVTAEDRATVKWNYLDQKWKFDTSGSDKGLTYSDFGYFTSTNVKKLKDVSIATNGEIIGTDTGSNKSTVMLFSGGYDILPEATRPAKGAKFEGTAIGVVRTSITGDNDHQAQYKNAFEHNLVGGHYNQSEEATLITQKATLEIDDQGKTILFMPFGSDGSATDVKLSGEKASVQWYDVRINDGVLSFETPSGKTIDTRFSHQGDVDGTPVIDEGYYGVTVPVEATGSVVYKETHDISDTNIGGNASRDFNFEAAYGMAQ